MIKVNEDFMVGSFKVRYPGLSTKARGMIALHNIDRPDNYLNPDRTYARIVLSYFKFVLEGDQGYNYVISATRTRELQRLERAAILNGVSVRIPEIRVENLQKSERFNGSGRVVLKRNLVTVAA